MNDVASERIRTWLIRATSLHRRNRHALRGPGEFLERSNREYQAAYRATYLRDADILELARNEARALILNATATEEIRGVVR